MKCGLIRLALMLSLAAASAAHAAYSFPTASRYTTCLSHSPQHNTNISVEGNLTWGRAAGDIVNHGFTCNAWYENDPYFDPKLFVNVQGNCQWTATSVDAESYVVGGTCPYVVGPAYKQLISPASLPLSPNGSHIAFVVKYAGHNPSVVHWASATHYVEMTDTNSRFGGNLNSSDVMF